ncbi:hypothetical protein C7S13_0981 [Burkholderia cepacia]|nr:hypothetical protein [Burkholderia cepacia]
MSPSSLLCAARRGAARIFSIVRRGPRWRPRDTTDEAYSRRRLPIQ